VFRPAIFSGLQQNLLFSASTLGDVMAFEIGTIDGISRQLRRDVLFIALLDEAGEHVDIYHKIDYITEWLDATDIPHQLCTAFTEDVIYIEGGPACIFLDVMAETDPEKLAALIAKFGNIEGKPLISGFQLCILKLEDAMQNAEQDDPAFWDKLV
jgi:hypothetical protein